MKAILVSLSALFVALIVPAPAQNVNDATDIVRSVYKTDRQTFVTDSLQLNERESAAFWPLYRSYRADMDKLGDGLLKLVLEYRDVYPNVPRDRAQKMLKDYAELEEKLVNTRSHYIQRAGREVSAAKALRWAQLENRMDLAFRLQLASAVPLVPATQ